jgi:diguanylate cyclase (GGDEF)-like protein/PAS domain S-box-containing protein
MSTPEYILVENNEETHRAKEHFYRSILDCMPQRLFWKDCNSVFRGCNLSGAHALNLSEAGEIVGKTDYDFFSPDDADYLRLKDEQVMSSGLASYHVEAYTRDGDTWLDVTKVPLRNESGEIYGLLICHEDVTERKITEKALEESEARYRLLFENMLDGFAYCMMQYDNYGCPVDFVFLNVNEAFGQLSGLKEVMGKLASEVIPGLIEKYPELLETPGRVASTGAPEKCQLNLKLWDKFFVVSIYSPDKGYFVAIFDDITERKKAEEQLRVASVAFENQDGIMITDADTNIIRVNRAFTEITGYSPEEVLGKNPRLLGSGRQDKAFYAAMWQQLLSTGSWAGEVWDRRKNGQIYPKWLSITAVKNQQGQTTEYVGMFHDITARKQAEEEIHNLAFYDVLTGLPNRRLFFDRFDKALIVSARLNNFGALLFIDLDRFKLLNDTLGHDYGDRLLAEVASRIKACVREMDTVARLGGDEFVVLIEGVSDAQDEASLKAAVLAEKIRESLAHPYDLNGHEHQSSPSIGVSLYRGNEESTDELLQHADMAMYQAKDSGRNAVRFFDPVMQNNVTMRAALLNDLRHAISLQQLHLYYQLQVDSDNRPVGAEALLRWIHPQRGMVMPEQLLQIAEESTLILDIGDWVLNTACRQLAVWSANEKMRDLVLTVNISAKQFALPDFVDRIASILQTHQISPARLKLEFTESMVLDDLPDTVEKMRALKALGVGLSMDDFGVRYSSLSSLKQLPFDQIKLARNFVRDVAIDGNVALLVQSIIDMSSKNRITVVAEGVESKAQLTSLKDRDCVAYQGFLFSKVLSIEEFEGLLNQS